jgi:uncharacterized membrane protein YphA (DoxX/SURF4 family)
MASTTRTGSKVVWTLQILLALLFLFAGGSKLAMSDQDLTAASATLSPLFLRFIGVCEILGGIGLVLPTLLKIRPGLTPIAAACLVVIMIGAVVTTAMTMPITYAIFPLVVGIAAAYIAYARWPLLRGAATAQYV